MCVVMGVTVPVTLLARSLPPGAGEDEVREAFSFCGGVVACKCVPKRHLAFVEFADPSGLHAALAQGPNFKFGDFSCFVEEARGAAGARTDGRQSGLHVCRVCGREFTCRAKLRAHESDPHAHDPLPVIGEWLGMECLSVFDLSPSAMVADLDPPLRELVRSYLRQAMPGSPEIALIIDEVVSHHPVTVRTKELFESVEVAKILGHHVHELQAQKKVTEVYDLACGHGLVGLLLAYRFPDLPVTCVDLEARPAWDQLVGAWRRVGFPSRGRSQSLENVSFVQDAIANVTCGPGSMVISVHACNEANLQVLEQSAAANASFGVVPCCIPERLYAGGCLSVTHLPDEARYAMMAGVIAKQYGASRVTAIDRRITNRNIVLCGRTPKTETRT